MRVHRGLYAFALLGALVVAFGGFAAAVVALLAIELDCGDGYGNSCHEGLVTTQIVVAIAGLIPAGGLFWAALTERWWVAAVLLIVTALCYLTWGVLNDAVVHGWDHLKVF